jgi:hypothetical protein
MSRRLRFVMPAAALALLSGAGPAGAVMVFSMQTDNWFVGSLVSSCIAVNRPMQEYNQSPWNSLALLAPKDGGIYVEVAFWPGLFRAGGSYQLALSVEGGGSYQIDADPSIGDYSLKSRGPAPDKLLGELGKARLLTAGATGVKQALAFDTTRLGDVLMALDNCRRVLAR